MNPYIKFQYSPSCSVSVQIIPSFLLHYSFQSLVKSYLFILLCKRLAFYRRYNPLVAEQVFENCLTSEQQISMTPSKICTCTRSPTKLVLSALKQQKKHLMRHQLQVMDEDEASSRFLSLQIVNM